MTIVNFFGADFFIFVDSKFVHGTPLLLTSSVNQIRIDKSNRSCRINSESAKFEVRFSKIEVKWRLRGLLRIRK